MAMTKKEKQELQDLVDIIKEKDMLLSLRHTDLDKIQPDVPAPKYGEPNTKGFTFCGALSVSYRLNSYASSATGHATSQDLSKPPTKINTKRAVTGYSTKLLALKAMRQKLCEDVAKELYKIDMQIKAESEKVSGS